MSTRSAPPVPSTPRAAFIRLAGLAAMLAGLAVAGPAAAQPIGGPGSTVAPVGPRDTPFRPFRFDEDFRGAARDRLPDWLRPLKAVPLGGGVTASLGGELRWRFEGVDEPRFGLAPVAEDDYVLQRALLHADLRTQAGHRAFVQLGSHYALGKALPNGPADENRLGVQQAFLDGPLPGVDATLRLGRQEIAFGSQRLVGVREGPNIRQAFDGARLLVPLGSGQGPGQGGVDLFLARPVAVTARPFGDEPDSRQLFWGAYGSGIATLAPGLRLDAYYLGLRRRDARFGPVTGTDRRHTLGGRLAGRSGAWDVNLDAGWQVGGHAGRDVSSGFAAGDAGYTLSALPWSPRLGLRAAWASGDEDPRDGDVGTFHPLFPRGAQFSEAGITGLANMIELFPHVVVQPAPTLAFLAGAELLWRQTTADAVYTQPFVPVPGTAGRGGRRTGTQWYAQASYVPATWWSLNAAVAYFETGPGLDAVGGRDSTYVGVWTALRF